MIMIINRLLRYLAFATIAGVFLTCSDHRFPDITPGSGTARLRVKSLTKELPNSLARVSKFTYDNQGWLSSIITYQTPDSSLAEVENSIYQYDGQNRLTQLRHEAIRYPRGSQPNSVEVYAYSYNTTGPVTGLSHSPGEPGYVLTFGYNATGKLASSGRSYSTGGLRIRGTDLFTFTGNNLTGINVSRTFAGMGGPEMTSTFSRTFTHDDKVNPFYGSYIIPAAYPDGFANPRLSPGLLYTYFGGIDNMLNLSQNNPLSGYFNGDLTYQYQYNTANLPTVRTTIANSATTETLRFEYESY